MQLKKGMKIATALKYTLGEDDSPKLLAKGKGYVAENIIEKAKEHDIPVFEDANLANQLMEMELNSNIPPELYEAVAQILVFIMEMDKDGY